MSALASNVSSMSMCISPSKTPAPAAALAGPAEVAEDQGLVLPALHAPEPVQLIGGGVGKGASCHFRKQQPAMVFDYVFAWQAHSSYGGPERREKKNTCIWKSIFLEAERAGDGHHENGGFCWQWQTPVQNPWITA